MSRFASFPMIATLFYFILNSIFSHAHAATISNDSYPFKREKIIINNEVKIECIGIFDFVGPIRRGDSLNVKSYFKSYTSDCDEKRILIKLNSDGGDVEEAIAIGEAIREYQLHTTVHDKCLSACVFVFAAGLIKSSPGGKIGIHRPYFSSLDSNENMASIQKKRQALEAKLRDYLINFDVNPELLQLMLSTPPHEMKVLSEKQLKYYRLDGWDSNYEEQSYAKSARSYGIGSAEYRKRQSEGLNGCEKSWKEQFHIDEVCVESIFWGISKPVYKDRLKRYDQLCLKLKGDQHLQCKIKVMRDGIF